MLGMMRRFAFVLLCLLIGCQATVDATVTPTDTPLPTMTLRVGVQFATIAPPTMAIVQVTPSPRPTATPTPTATPIIYTVREGDTLWSIALQNRTLPETLETLNVNLRPESLQIGQEIVLPPQPTALAAAAVGTEIPIEIVVNSVAFYRTPIGGGWVLGEIENVGVFSAENIRLQIGLLNAQGESLAEITAAAAPPFNIASYALLAHMMAHVTGLKVGEFIHTFGDAHLYLNHLEQADEQLTREPHPLPRLVIKRDVSEIDGFQFGDFEIVGYEPYSHIAAPVAV
ncbi:MAG: thymidylate synthase [Pseudomonadota bacterium]